MKPLRFIHISDPHIAIDYEGTRITRLHNKTGITLTEQLEISMRDIMRSSGDIDFIIISGDIVHESSEADYKYFYDRFGSMCGEIPFHIALGNHDLDSKWRGCPDVTVGDILGENCDYVIEKGGLHIIFLDSRGGPYGSGKLYKVQFEWLKNQLDILGGKPCIIVMHHTPHISREIPDLEYQMQDSVEFYNAVKDCNIKGIFSGHTHRHFISQLGTIPCYTAPSITFGITTTETDMSWDNITGGNVCDYTDDGLQVKYVPIIPDTVYREDILYSELYSS